MNQTTIMPSLTNGLANPNLTQPPMLISPMMVNKNNQISPYVHQQPPPPPPPPPPHQQQQQPLQQYHPQQPQPQIHQTMNQAPISQQLQQQLHLQQQQQQQQVPMTTIMIPATAAAQLQSASVQIQQAAMQAMMNNSGQPQILVFMIPYMVPTSQPPIMPPTPSQASLNSTLVRQSQTTGSLIRAAQQPQQQQQPQVQQPLQSQQQQQPLSGSSHSRAVSSLSNAKHEAEKFYIKANFSYQASRNKMELTFQKGDILHVIDTLQNSEYSLQASQYWLATRVKSNGKDLDKGLIPDKNKAEELALEQRTQDLTETVGAVDGSSGSGSMLSAGVGRVNFLKRRAAQRSKSLCRDNWDNVVFDIGSFKLPAYERVVFKHPGFCRPVVIFGPLADVAREKLLKDYPEKYSYPNGFNNQAHDHPKVIRLNGILEVIDQGKHALLDITPSAVEKLNYVNLAPIVIFMKSDSKSIIKEFRSRAAKSLNANARDDDTLRRDGKSSRKLLEQSIKLEKVWCHVFTATLNLSTMGSEMWYRKLRETIENQQSANVWMSEKKADKKIALLTGNSSVNNTNSSNLNNNINNNDVLFSMPTQSSSSCIDNASFINERFSESLNITSKSTLDLLSDGAYNDNRNHLRSAYAQNMAQKLARASSDPKLSGMMSSNISDASNIRNVDDGDDDDDEDEDDDDDEIIKKPFPAPYENSSSISSSNGGGALVMGSMTSVGPPQMTYQHYSPQVAQQDNQVMVNSSNINNKNNSNNNNLARVTQESIYSRNPLVNNNNVNSSYSNGNSSSLSNYLPLPPMTSEAGYQLHHNNHQSMNSINSNNVIDLSRNHETRGSAFQVYSDMNQNNYHYYNLNKI